jgi:hypothetical protein
MVRKEEASGITCQHAAASTFNLDMSSLAMTPVLLEINSVVLETKVF